MIAKVTRGSGFQGLQAYLLTGKNGQEVERVSWISARNLPSPDPELAAVFMRDTAAKSTQVEKPVYHLTISLAPEESLDREAMSRVVERTLRDVGLEEHQALVVAHHDTGHQHVHVMLNRVHPARHTAWDNGHDYARMERSLRRQEQELGLRQVPGRHYSTHGDERHRGADLSSGDRRFAQRTGERPFAEHVREVARADLKEARSWGELHEQLAEYGLRLEKRGRGLAVTDGHQRVKASFVDRESSLARLEKRLGTWQAPGRDFPAGKSDRWQEVQGLRRAAERLWKRHELDHQHRAERLNRWEQNRVVKERPRLEARMRTASAQLDERLRSAYRKPAEARQAIERYARANGPEATARELTKQPGQFGRLRGRGGPVPSSDRKTAIASARAAGNSLRDLERVKQALVRVPRLSRKVPMPTRAGRRQTDRERPSKSDLARSAERLVKNVGWALAARVTPVAHYQVLKLSLSIPRKIIEASLGRERGFHR